MNIFHIKPTVNKANGQINFSLPKKALSKQQLNDINSKEKIKIMFMGRKLKL